MTEKHCTDLTPHGPHTVDRGAFGVVRCYGAKELVVDPQPEGQAPVTGYTKQPPRKVDLVNEIKELENAVGDQLAEVLQTEVVDPRMVALARTNLQQGFMWLVRSVFQPESRL